MVINQQQGSANSKRVVASPKQNKFSLMKVTVLLILCLSFGLATFFLDVMRVTGNSMNPTLQAGKVLLVNKSLDYQHNDLIVFHPPDSLKARPSRFIKRLIASCR